MRPTSINELYEWEQIDIKEHMEAEDCFLEAELKMAHYGIQTRVEVHHETQETSLWVPLKDASIAKGILFQNISEVIDLPVETYHVFEKDLSYKNEALYEDKYKRNIRAIRIRNFVILAVVLLTLLLVFRFVNFS